MSVRVPNVTWRQVHAWRLGRQFLDGPAAPSALDVVRRLCGVQAQQLSSATDAVDLRLVRAADRRAVDPVACDLAAGLRRGDLIRTWAMRGTPHLLDPAQAGAYLALVAAARSWTRGSWQTAFVSLAQLDALTEAVEGALSPGHPLTRDELVAHVGRRVRDDHLMAQLASSWGALLKPLAWQGLICQGPPQGAGVTFARPADVASHWSGLPEADVAAQLVVPAYLGAYGPATLAGFDAWLLRGGTPRARLRRWFAEPAEDTTVVEVDGEPRHMLTAQREALVDTRPSAVVRLLPAFDQFVLGPGTADPHVVPSRFQSTVSRAAGWIAPVVVTCDGVVGTWTLTRTSARVELFDDAPAPDPAALAAEIERAGSVPRLPVAAPG